MKAYPTDTGDDLLRLDGANDLFVRFDIGISWLYPQGDDHFARHWLVVIGLQKDDRYRVVYEASGTLPEIAAAAVDAKDRFLVKRVWVNLNQIACVSYLQDHDGLTNYATKGKDSHGEPIYTNPPEYWAHFRGRDRKKYCADLQAVPDVFITDLQAGIDLVVGLMEVRPKRFLIRKSCGKSHWITGAQLPEMLTHPLMRAIAWPIMAMEQERQVLGRVFEPTKPRYGNLT